MLRSIVNDILNFQVRCYADFMKPLAFLIVIIFLFPTSSLLATEMKGTLSCRVLSVNLTQMEEGRVVNYSGYKGGMKEGHTFFVDYEYDPLIRYVKVKGRSNDFSYRSSGGSGYIEKGTKAMREGYPNTFGTKNNDVTIGSDFLSGDAIFDEISLSRYYKNDWHGLYVKDSSDAILVAGLDCRHISDSIDEIVSDLKTKGY